jgi:hypothetical protein
MFIVDPIVAGGIVHAYASYADCGPSMNSTLSRSSQRRWMSHNRKRRGISGSGRRVGVVVV